MNNYLIVGEFLEIGKVLVKQLTDVGSIGYATYNNIALESTNHSSGCWKIKY